MSSDRHKWQRFIKKIQEDLQAWSFEIVTFTTHLSMPSSFMSNGTSFLGRWYCNSTSWGTVWVLFRYSFCVCNFSFQNSDVQWVTSQIHESGFSQADDLRRSYCIILMMTLGDASKYISYYHRTNLVMCQKRTVIEFYSMKMTERWCLLPQSPKILSKQ